MTKRLQKRIEIDGKWYRLKANGKPGVELSYCSNTKTKAEVMSLVLSALRRATKYWKPKLDKLNEGKRAYRGTNPRQKWEYQCEKCLRWFKKDDIEMDHILPCGGIDDFSKVSDWCIRAFVEKDGYQRLCSKCHKIKTRRDRGLDV